VAYVFNEPAGGWSGPQTQAAVLTAGATHNGEDLFGWSVGISGNTIVVGAPYYAGVEQQAQGAAYVFSGPWSGTQTRPPLLASDHTSNDELGWSVAVSGNTVVAGRINHQVGSNPGQGAAYVFVMPTTGPWVSRTQTAELTAVRRPSRRRARLVGRGLGQHDRRRRARGVEVGSNDSQGASYVYTQPSHGWATTNAPTPPS
jgi:hypothetical protein